MKEDIKRIYDLLYSPIITPYNLLENAKLQNYSYVNYYKGKNGLIAEMKCTIENEGEAIFYYHFDVEDKLVQVYMKNSKFSKPELVYDREIELGHAKADYFSSKGEEDGKVVSVL